MQSSQHLTNNLTRYRWLMRGVTCLLLLSIFFIGQAIAQFSVTAPYSPRDQSISALGITACEDFKEPQTQQLFYVCSPLHFVLDGTFIISGLLTMLATTLVIRPLWPGKKLRSAGISLIFFGGIEEVVAGFSPLNLNLFLHSLSGGLAIAALNIGMLLLGFAAVRKLPLQGWHALTLGMIGMVGLIMSGTPPYAWLGYGGWERVAGYAFPLWGISIGIYWLIQLSSKRLPFLKDGDHRHSIRLT